MAKLEKKSRKKEPKKLETQEKEKPIRR